MPSIIAKMLAMARPRLISLMLALVTLLVYLPVRQHSFLDYDDGAYISENLMVQAGLTWAGVKWAFTTGHCSNWHPLTWLSHMLDCECFGLDTGAHHLVSLSFHLANSVLLFLLLLRLTEALWPAAMVAALFAWHPLHIESVAWAAERKDVLSALFALLALLAYTRYAREKRRGSFWLAWLLFALGLMAKPMLVTLPFVMLLLDVWPLRRRPDAAWRISGLFPLAREKWPFFLLSAASCVVTFLAQRGEAVVAMDQHPLDLRLKNALVSYANYLAKTVWPANLAVIYPLPKHISWAAVAAAALALAALSWWVWHERRRQPYLATGWLWFLGTLVPVIGLVQVGGQAMADRYTYLPLIGVFVAAVFAAAHWARRFQSGPAVAASLAGLVLLSCLACTTRQLRYWRDSESLFAHAVAVTKDNAIALLNLGVALEQQGRWDEALARYQAALRLEPNRAQVHNNLANLLDESGQTNEALLHYREALRLKPNAPLAHDNLGILLVKLRRFDEAMSHYTEAARLAPADPRPHYLMGQAQLAQHRSAQAIAHFRDALRRDANHFLTLNSLARVLASDEDPQLRHSMEALTLAERANALTGGAQPFMLDTLAMACAEAGRFEDAQSAIQKAIELATTAKKWEMVAAMKQRLALYLARQPFHEPATSTPPAKVTSPSTANPYKE